MAKAQPIPIPVDVAVDSVLIFLCLSFKSQRWDDEVAAPCWQTALYYSVVKISAGPEKTLYPFPLGVECPARACFQSLPVSPGCHDLLITYAAYRLPRHHIAWQPAWMISAFKLDHNREPPFGGCS